MLFFRCSPIAYCLLPIASSRQTPICRDDQIRFDFPIRVPSSVSESKKRQASVWMPVFYGTPEGTRTPDLLVRSSDSAVFYRYRKYEKVRYSNEFWHFAYQLVLAQIHLLAQVFAPNLRQKKQGRSAQTEPCRGLLTTNDFPPRRKGERVPWLSWMTVDAHGRCLLHQRRGTPLIHGFFLFRQGTG